MTASDLLDYSSMPSEAWARLSQGAADSSNPMHLVTLATVGVDHRPGARIVVLRGAAADYNFSGSAALYTAGGRFGSTATSTPGRDAVYTFIAPATGIYSFRVTDYSTGQNAVLWATSTCPSASTPDAGVILAANRGSTSPSEELSCVLLAAGQQVWIVVDDASVSNAGSAFVIEATRCDWESEPNSAPATSNTYTLGDSGMEGSIAPAGDVDFFSMGSPPAGSRVFAMIDGVQAGSTVDFDLRVTTATDTLEMDGINADVPFGTTSPVIAGTVLTGAPAYLRANYAATTAAEPYRLYAIVQPPSASAVSETEPNGTAGAANSHPSNYFTGVVSSTFDVDVFAFEATVGQIIFLAVDAFPGRAGAASGLNAALGLLDSSGALLLGVNDFQVTVNTTPGTGTLDATTPNSPSEGLVWRARYTGTHYAQVGASAGFGPYLLSISTTPAPVAGSCCVGPVCSLTNDLTCQSLLGDFSTGGSCSTSACEMGACCKPDSTCALANSAACEALAGVLQGAGTACGSVTCPASGTCCLGAACSIAFQATCTSGDWIPGGTCGPEHRCAGACCDVATSTCVATTPAACAGTGLVFAGAGTSCATNPCPAPGNDVCGMDSAAFTIPGTGGTVLGSLLGASSEGNAASSCQSGTGQRDVFYSFTPATSCGWVFSLCGGPTQDTTLSLHSACPTAGANNQISSTACDNDGCGIVGGPAMLALPFGTLAAGSLNVVRVSTRDSAAQPVNFVLTVSQGGAPNDHCSTAETVEVTSGSGTAINDTTCALAQLDPLTIAPSCGGAAPRDLWYRFVTSATQGGPWIINTCSASGTDTVVEVYTGSCGSLVPVPGGCNDDAPLGSRCASPRSEVVVTLSASTTYRVRVMAGAGSPTGGAFALNILYGVVPTNDACTSATVLTVPTAAPTIVSGTSQLTTLDGPTTSTQCSPNVAVDYVGSPGTELEFAL